MKMIRIGEVILRERTKKKLTQQEIADFFNVTKATISKWENGASYPDITLLPLIASYFNLTVDELLNAKQVMKKEEIRKWYKRFAQRFSNEPFDLVLEDLQQFKKLYYDDENFLLQMAILLLNHADISPQSTTIFKQTTDILERVESLTDDVWIRRQANMLIATIALFNQEPSKTLERLKDGVRPFLGEEMLLAQAHEALGEQKKAKEVLQVMMYQQLIFLIGTGTAYLKLTIDEENLFFETIDRMESMIKYFEVEALHPNVSLQFYYAVAQYSAIRGDEVLCKKYLEKFTNLISTGFLPFKLRGDRYFSLLDNWFETLDLGINPLREDNVIVESIFQSFEHPSFKRYAEKDWFIQLQEKIQFSMERFI